MLKKYKHFVFQLIFPNMLTRYIFRNIIPYFFTGILIFSLINFLQYLTEFTDLAIKYHTPLLKVLKTMVYIIPFVMSFTIPVGVMIGVLMSLGQLNSSNEVIALRTNGFSFTKIINPILVFSLLVFIFQLIFFQWILPWGNYHFIKSKYQMMIQNPLSELHYNHSLNLDSNQIYVTAYHKNKLSKITIINSYKNTIYFALSGEILRDNTMQFIPLHLKNVYTFPYHAKMQNEEAHFAFYKDITFFLHIPTPHNILASSTATKSLSELYFHRLETINRKTSLGITKFQEYIQSTVNLKKFKKENPDFTSDKIKSKLTSLENTVKHKENTWKRSTSIGEALGGETYTFYRKIAFAFSSIIMGILATPLALFNVRGGKDISLGISIIMVLIFNSASIMGNIAYKHNWLSPMIAAWFSCIVMSFLAVIIILLKVKTLNHKIFTWPKRLKG